MSSGAHTADEKAGKAKEAARKTLHQVQAETYASKQQKAYLDSNFTTLLAADNTGGTTEKYWVVAEVWTDDGQHLFIGDFLHPQPSWDHVPAGQVNLADIQNNNLRIVKFGFTWKLQPSIFAPSYPDQMTYKESDPGTYFKVAGVSWKGFNDFTLAGLEVPIP
jgi:hypothetical protein